MRTRPRRIPAFPPLFALAVLLCPSVVEAQVLREGSVVRIHRAAPPPLRGAITGMSADTLWLRVARMVEPIPITAIQRLELRQREARAQSGWRWAKRGLLAGAVLGGATCLADRDGCVSGLGPEDGLAEGFLAASMFFGGGGGFIGFLGGATLPGHRWIEVPPAPAPLAQPTR